MSFLINVISIVYITILRLFFTNSPIFGSFSQKSNGFSLQFSNSFCTIQADKEMHSPEKQYLRQRRCYRREHPSPKKLL